MRRLIAFLTILFSLPAQAGLIRDAEIERDVRDLVTPVWEAAGLDPKSVKLFILADPSINAYVAGGTNIFVHTGLLQAAETPEMLIGVLAHETGHIVGGHLALGAERMKGASLGALISMVLGAAAVAGGQGQVGSAILTAGPGAMQRGMLAFSRSNEQAADQAALRFLDETDVTPKGMLDMFVRLRRDEKRYMGRVDPYAITHPLTTERIDTVRAAVERSPKKDDLYPEAIRESHRRMIAKVQGFLDPAPQVLAQRGNEISIAGRYASAIALFRLSRIDQALERMDRLIAAEPENGWFHELKGQMLFENGRIADAEKEYAEAVRLRPNEPIIRTEYAKTLLAAGNAKPSDVNTAIAMLERASVDDASYSETWRLLADAYGRRGLEGKSHLALAEQSALDDNLDATRIQADMALKSLERDTPGYLRAQDLKTFSIRLARERREDGETRGKRGFAG